MNTQTENVENVEVNELTIEQVNTLKSRGIDETLIQVLSFEQLTELLEKSEKESLTIKIKSTRTNICTELVKTFENEEIVELTKSEIIEKICLISQKNFFEITNNGKEFLLTNTQHAKVFMLLKDYEFKTVLTKNKQVSACADLKSKNTKTIQLWLKRGVQILGEIANVDHAKYFNGYELDYRMNVENDTYTFTRK